MSAVLANVVDLTDASSHRANYSEFPFGANVLSLETRRDLRRSVLAADSEGVQAELRREKAHSKLLLDLVREAVSNRSFASLSGQS